MPRISIAFLASVLLCLGGSAASAYEATPENVVRLESTTAGVAVDVPAGWVVQTVAAEVPGLPELLIVLHAQPPEPGVSCSMMVDRTERPSLADHADAFRPDGPARTTVRLPAGDAVRWDEDQGDGAHATYYLLQAPDGVLMFMCGGLTAPGDEWLSMVQTIEFLPQATG